MSHPGTVAIIDVGSNSVRLLVARALSPLAFEVVDEERFDARLGEGQDGGDLTPDGIARGLRALRIMAQVAASSSPTVTVAVGTEALRRAPNATEFIDRARQETGLRVRVLSGYDEAFCGFLGVVNSTSLRDGRLLDIGAVSCSNWMRVADAGWSINQSAPSPAPSTPANATSNCICRRSRGPLRLEKAVRQNLSAGDPQRCVAWDGRRCPNLARWPGFGAPGTCCAPPSASNSPGAKSTACGCAHAGPLG